MTPTFAGLVKDLTASLSDLAAALYAIEGSADMLFVKAEADAGSLAAAALASALAAAWEHYPVATAGVDQLRAAVAADDAAGIDRLLAPDGVTLPDGTTAALPDLVARLTHDVAGLGEDVSRIAASARAILGRLDQAAAETRDLVARATAVGAARDPEMTALVAAVDQAAGAVAADPLTAAAVDAIGLRLEAARGRVEGLEDHRRSLPAQLAAAAVQLGEIERLVDTGTTSFAHARDRIASPKGLLEPLDLDGTDGRGLRPWLARISGQADAGAWETAYQGLTSWQATADAWLVSATEVAGANAAPVTRRNELRGLLDAYRAKAVAKGRAEDDRLTLTYAAARALLYSKPCALDEAEARVRAYVTEVNNAGSGPG